MSLITNLAGLESAFTNGGTYTIAPGTYVLDNSIEYSKTADLSITHDGTAGDVIIDGDNLYEIVFLNSITSGTRNITISGLSATKKIVFTKGKYVGAGGGGVTLFGHSAFAGDLAGTFSYCDFCTNTATIAAGSSNGTGFMLASTGGTIRGVAATLNNCNAFGNRSDGFSIGATEDATLVKKHILVLNNCTAYNNGLVYIDGGEGDGVTSHRISHYVTVNGGSYYSNGKTGAAIVGIGSSPGTCIIYGGAKFYNNGGVQSATVGHQIVYGGVSSGGLLLVDGIEAYVDVGQTDRRIIGVTNATAILRNCLLRGLTAQDLYNTAGTTAIIMSSFDQNKVYNSGTVYLDKILPRTLIETLRTAGVETSLLVDFDKAEDGRTRRLLGR